MCIVTYFPKSDGFIFSSNRDENHNRPTLEPAFYAQPSTLMYPKDLDHGGTWFARYVRCVFLGNTVYSDSQLNQVLKIKKGDTYNGVELEKRIAWHHVIHPPRY